MSYDIYRYMHHIYICANINNFSRTFIISIIIRSIVIENWIFVELWRNFYKNNYTLLYVINFLGQFELKVIKFDSRIHFCIILRDENVFENQKTEWLKIPNIKLFILQQFIIFPSGKCSKSNHLNFLPSPLHYKMIHWIHRYIKYNVVYFNTNVIWK